MQDSLHYNISQITWGGKLIFCMWLDTIEAITLLNYLKLSRVSLVSRMGRGTSRHLKNLQIYSVISSGCVGTPGVILEIGVSIWKREKGHFFNEVFCGKALIF